MMPPSFEALGDGVPAPTQFSANLGAKSIRRERPAFKRRDAHAEKSSAGFNVRETSHFEIGVHAFVKPSVCGSEP